MTNPILQKAKDIYFKMKEEGNKNECNWRMLWIEKVKKLSTKTERILADCDPGGDYYIWDSVDAILNALEGKTLTDYIWFLDEDDDYTFLVFVCLYKKSKDQKKKSEIKNLYLQIKNDCENMGIENWEPILRNELNKLSVTENMENQLLETDECELSPEMLVDIFEKIKDKALIKHFQFLSDDKETNNIIYLFKK